jgi:hypothetical protein
MPKKISVVGPLSPTFGKRDLSGVAIMSGKAPDPCLEPVASQQAGSKLEQGLCPVPIGVLR